MLNGEFLKICDFVHAKEKTLNMDLKQFLKTHMPNLCLKILTTTSYEKYKRVMHKMRFHGVMVSTLDSESSDPSSNLGGTSYHRTC